MDDNLQKHKPGEDIDGQSAPDTAVPPAPALPESDSPEVHEMERNVEEAKAKKEDAKEKTIKAVRDVKMVGEYSRQNQDSMQQWTTYAKKVVGQAKTELNEAKEKQSQVEDKLKETQLKKIANAGPTIAGYKPVELIKALSKVPEPRENVEPAPTIDDSEQKNIKEQAEKTKDEIETSLKHVEEAEKELDKVDETIQEASKVQEEVMTKLGNVDKELASS